MKKLTICIVLASLCLNFRAYSQASAALHTVNIGEEIPDVLLTSFLYYNQPTLRLTDFKNKLVVLDFWATWCGSCIAAFPRNDSLQSRYAKQLQIIGVNSRGNHDTKAIIERFYDRRPSLHKIPTVYEDTLLTRLFPHRGIPHYVWVFQNKVVAITDAEALTAGHIESVIHNGSIRVQEKRDIAYDRRRPVFLNGNGGEADRYLFRTIVTPFQSGLAAAMQLDAASSGLVNRCLFVNQSKLEMLQFVSPAYAHFGKNRIHYQVAHPEDYALDSSSAAWKARNTFIYEASFPPLSRPDALHFIQEELHRYFKVSLDSEVVKAPCLVLVRSGRRNPQSAPGDTVSTNLYDMDEQPIYLQNLPIVEFVEHLNEVYALPVVNETGISGGITLRLPARQAGNRALEKSLELQGLRLVPATRMLSFLVLKEDKQPD
ncbi:TlpA family protein disulfide reductase [Mucilaginibacter lacusdianchii]|uniref:TlpA family protein disulfide reductase n=1 Tax=Mucilaginibacter lacusdianchii TaxID=2684211 RepID=UPI00131E3629|nr:TlpA disulfide reductase family protein [Mucilaginibacter sp. JXJ CY 39]